MRIMLVSFRFGKNIPGGAERYLWELMSRLAQGGHEVEVFTTCSLQMIRSPFGYCLWDNGLPEGREEEEGVVTRRYPVSNPAPRRAKRYWEQLILENEKVRRKPEFISCMKSALEGTGEHCFLTGWHASEEREDGCVRWSARQAHLLAAGDGISDIWLEVSAPLDEDLSLQVDEDRPLRFGLEKGRRQKVHATLSPRDSITVSVGVPKVFRPPQDGRDLGVLVHGAEVGDGKGTRELDISRGWDEFVRTGPEEVLGKALWWRALNLPPKYSRKHKYVMGPRSPHMEREVKAMAGGCDVILGCMAPMSSLSLAAEAAAGAGKPFIAIPLFHPRDTNHYYDHLYDAMAGARGVEANLQGIADIMTAWGFNAFAVGPGFNLEELLSPRIDGGRFRREFGLQSVPLLLWVARKNSGKGYREAAEALAYVRGEGCPAELVMIGPEEDYLPVSGEGVHYLGPLSRDKVLDAYDACDLFLFPSLYESFCLVFGEAWLRGKPVLGNAWCTAARDQISHGQDGYLCRDPLEYGRMALKLLRDPALAREMGGRGKEKVMALRGWDRIAAEFEAKLREIAGA
jgi:glycosyltransferase involved in cell wall biosynthesis